MFYLLTKRKIGNPDKTTGPLYDKEIPSGSLDSNEGKGINAECPRFFHRFLAIADEWR